MEFFEHRRIQSLACRGTVLEGTEVEAVEVLLDKETIDSGRSAERCNTVFSYQRQKFSGYKFLMVINEDRSTHYPLPVKFSPHSLPPSGIRVGEVNAVRSQLMPICSRHQMAESISMAMKNHFGFIGST